MKVILLADVKALGKRGDLADVADGYANNFLLRRNLATVATAGAIKQLEQQNSAKNRRQAEEVANAQDVATQLEAAILEIPAKAGGNGRLFVPDRSASRQQCHREVEYSGRRGKVTPVASDRESAHVGRFRRKYGGDEGLRRQVAALFDILSGALGKDKVVMRAGKLGALKLMRSQAVGERLLALQRLGFEDPNLP